MKIFIVVSYAGHYSAAFSTRKEAVAYIEDNFLSAEILEDEL